MVEKVVRFGPFSVVLALGPKLVNVTNFHENVYKIKRTDGQTSLEE